MKKISIVIPVYNAERFLDACVTSVLRQRYTNWELLLVNDGSKDDSLAICRRFAEQDGRIFVWDKENSGVSSARNLGLQNATGDYVTFIDSDDFVAPDYCDRLLRHMTDGVGMVVLGLTKVTAGGEQFLVKHRLPEGKYDYAHLRSIIVDDGSLSGFTIFAGCGILFDMALIRAMGLSFQEDVPFCEDGLFNTLYFLQSHRAAYINYWDAPYFYRVNDASASRTVDVLGERYVASMAAVEKELLKYAPRFPQANIPDQLKKRRATLMLNQLGYLASKGQLTRKRVKELVGQPRAQEGLKLIRGKDLFPNKRPVLLAMRMKAYTVLTLALNKFYGAK